MKLKKPESSGDAVVLQPTCMVASLWKAEFARSFSLFFQTVCAHFMEVLATRRKCFEMVADAFRRAQRRAAGFADLRHGAHFGSKSCCRL